MEDLGRPRRRRPALMLAGMLLATVCPAVAEPVSISPRWEVDYPPAANGRAGESTAVLLDGHSLLVAVITQGAEVSKGSVKLGNRSITSQLVGCDLVSRLAFFKVEGVTAPKPTIWLNEVGANASASLMTVTPSGTLKCRSNGWVKQIGGKVLPLALLRVNFDQAVPPSGSPIVDSEGRVVGIMFQPAGSGNTGYAIPAEAIHRVRKDVSGGGKLVRGWLGLSLRAETQTPQVVRVLPGSPAAQAGIQPSDVIQSVAGRPISDYADAANAFFYLTPGQPVQLRLLRGSDQLDFTLTPTKPAE
jgi:hypothetical protein